jgi:folate-binding protein YgfZ
MSTLYVSTLDLGIFKITGPDTIRYLQGRCTQNIKTISNGESRWSFILSPQGKIEGKFYLRINEDGCLIVVDVVSKEAREEFLKSLFRFKVADQVFAEDLSDSHQVMTFYSKDSISETIISNLPDNFYYPSLISRGSLNCLDVVIEKGSTHDLSFLKMNCDKVDTLHFERMRIEAGFPLQEKDITSSIFAPDLPLATYVSFNKGCYAGQEVVEMATARGRPNRVFVKIEGSETLSSSSDLLVFFKKEGEDSPKKAGFVTSIVSNDPDPGFVALGFIKSVFSEEKGEFILGQDETGATLVSLSFVS